MQRLEVEFCRAGEAKRLYRRNPKAGKRRSLRKVAGELATMGFSRDGGLPFNAMSIRNMVGGLIGNKQH
jgi:hypothetical protein